MNDDKKVIRNIFEFENEPKYWQEANKDFPNKVPRFNTKEEVYY